MKLTSTPLLLPVVPERVNYQMRRMKSSRRNPKAAHLQNSTSSSSHLYPSHSASPARPTIPSPTTPASSSTPPPPRTHSPPSHHRSSNSSLPPSSEPPPHSRRAAPEWRGGPERRRGARRRGRRRNRLFGERARRECRIRWRGWLGCRQIEDRGRRSAMRGSLGCQWERVGGTIR